MEKAGKIKVFLVDDDKMFLKAMEHSIGKNLTNIEIQTFFNGEECIQKLNENPLLVILDYHLNSDDPKAKNGVDVLKDIKSRAQFSEVIMLSSQEDVNIAIETLKYGALDYVVKDDKCFDKIIDTLTRIESEIDTSNELEKESNKMRKITIIVLIVILLSIILSSII